MIKYGISAFLLVAVFFLAVWAQTDRDLNRPGLRIPGEEASDLSANNAAKKKRIREGTVFKGKRCIFRPLAQRVLIFSEDESERFFCLENLNLERVMKVVLENPAQQIWNVDGTYTEYQGENYVLIQRVVLAPPRQ